MKKAFLLFGGLTTGRYPAFLDELHQSELAILVFEIDSPRMQELALVRKEMSGHPFQLIQDVCLLDPNDSGRVLQQIVLWQKDFEICGTLTIKEELVGINSIAADFLNLPHVGLRAAAVCRDKLLQRTYLRKWSPQLHILRPTAEPPAKLQFPAVLKPVGRQASSGVLRIDTEQELRSSLKEYKAGETLLLEEFIRGEEISVESLVQNRCPVFVGITAKRTNSENTKFFVETAHTFPHERLSADRKASVLKANSEILSILGLQDGITHAEYKITADGRVFLIEIAARMPGDGIMQIYQLIRLALGKPVTVPEPRRCARQVYLQSSPGIFREASLKDSHCELNFFRKTRLRPRLTPRSPGDPSWLHEVMVEKLPGDPVNEVRESNDRLGFMIFDAPNADELDRAEIEMKQRLVVNVQGV